jgi:hypothetical protein
MLQAGLFHTYEVVVMLLFCRRPFYLEPASKRQKSIYQQFNFQCQCEACMDEEKFAMFKISSNEDISTDRHEILSQYRENCKYIHENFEQYPSINLIQINNDCRRQLDKLVEINHDF